MSKAGDMGGRRFSSARGRTLVASVAVIGFAAGLWLLWGNRGSDSMALREAAAAGIVSVNRPTPAFTRPLVSETGSLSLSQYQGKAVVVNFWASWCTACRSEVPQLEGLWRSYRGRGVQLVGVDYEDRRSAAINFARSLGMSYPSVLDPDGSVGDAYGIFGLPTTYIIAPDGRIRYVVNGKIRVASFRAALESVLPVLGGA
jgi:cytochrome c biogenesis protein CcmG/thiol:disulfide interchange protein DsbE